MYNKLFITRRLILIKYDVKVHKVILTPSGIRISSLLTIYFVKMYFYLAIRATS